MRYIVLLLVFFITINSNGQKNNRAINRINTLNKNNIENKVINADSSFSYGVVVVKITVNRNGDVISADPVLEKSTTGDSVLLQSAKKAALKAKFSKNAHVAAKQYGFITYKYKIIH